MGEKLICLPEHERAEHCPDALPDAVLPKSRHGSLHLHGHMHNDMIYNEKNREEGIRRYDVGVDANYYYPVSLQQILQFFGI